MSLELIAGVDIGGTHSRIAIMSVHDKSILMTKKIKTVDIFKNYSDAIDAIANFLQEFMQEYPKISTIVIGFPATINANRTSILSCPNIEILDKEKRDITSALSTMLSKNIFIERDVHLQLCFDMDYHNIQENVVVGFYVGTGFGQAIWINNLYTGSHGVAGEVGHIPFSQTKNHCGCGNEYCLESICSGKWLYKWYQEQKLDIAIDDVWSKYAEFTELQSFVDKIARTAATTVNIIDPSAIIFGGGVIDMKLFPKDELIAKTIEYSRHPLPANALQTYFAQTSNSNGAIGACLYGYRQTSLSHIT